MRSTPKHEYIERGLEGGPWSELLAQVRPTDRLELLRQGRGIWKDRSDLPDTTGLRAELDRFNRADSTLPSSRDRYCEQRP